MRVIVNENSKEEEVIINCEKVDNRLNTLIDYVHQYSIVLKGIYNSEIYMLLAEKILFIDCTDGRSFLYTTDRVYESRESLSSLEKSLINTPFLRISKNCILNTSYLKSVKSIFNHRMEATLTNGEKLIISRSYIKDLKNKLKDY